MRVAQSWLWGSRIALINLYAYMVLLNLVTPHTLSSMAPQNYLVF